MEIQTIHSCNLSDFEVFNFLKEIKSAQQRNTPTPLATITYEALRYLEDRPGAKMTAEQITEACLKYEALPFTMKPQCIAQLINDPPVGMVDVQVILGEDLHEKSDEDIEAIINASREIFPDITS